MSDVDDQRLHAIVHLQFVFSHAQRKPVGQAQCLVRGRAGRDEAGRGCGGGVERHRGGGAGLAVAQAAAAPAEGESEAQDGGEAQERQAEAVV